MTPLERCDAELAEVERLLRAGHPDVQGLTLALSDWEAEKRAIAAQQEQA